MEQPGTPIADPVKHCDGCYIAVTNDDFYCTHCGYPLKGTADEQRKFVISLSQKEAALPEFEKKVERAGDTLYYLGGIFVLYSGYNFWHNKDNPSVLAIVLPNLVLAILFLLLAGFSKQKPLACFVSGLCLYLIVQVLILVSNPSRIDLGFFVKIIIIVFLIKGIKSAIEVERIKKEGTSG